MEVFPLFRGVEAFPLFRGVEVFPAYGEALPLFREQFGSLDFPLFRVELGALGFRGEVGGLFLGVMTISVLGSKAYTILVKIV